MTNRVDTLAKRSQAEDLLAPFIKPQYDPRDLALNEAEFNAKRITDYLMAQPVYRTDENRFTGMMRWGGAEVPADIFTRKGHHHFSAVRDAYYRKYIDNLVVFEWQHSAPNYRFIVENGIEGTLRKIEFFKEKYRYDQARHEFLKAEETVCRKVIAWAEKCAAEHEQAAASCTDPIRKGELLEVAKNCRTVPRLPAESFYQGLQSILFCFQCLPDSVGTIDRTLYNLYKKDLEEGVLTREEAKELLSEFYVHLSNYTAAGTPNADRSAECHFAIGGYTELGEDGFTDLSRLMVEALMETDTRRPAISLRWTPKTPFEVLKFMLDCERKDPYKRFAFVNDVPRIKALTNICGLSFSDAVRYTMVGCNEPSFPGTIWMGGCTTNIARSMVHALHREEAKHCTTFEEFYALWREEMAKDIRTILEYLDLFNEMRSKDISVLSSFLLDGCIENAAGPNQYGCTIKMAGFSAMGITSTIDSLAIIKQFVFEEQRVTLPYLIEVLESNWEKDPALRTEILKRGRFFGNNDPLSDEIARRFTTELYNLTKNHTAKCGAKILIGTLAGYNPHHMNYGNMTAATPDGRMDGDGFMVGTGQAGGKDRKGLLPLMRSLAQMDPNGILCGPNVCNMLLDEKLIRNDDSFDKVCRMIETYFREGGLHVQLNYVSKEELLAARAEPEKYQSLKVRVSGYAGTFVKLPEKHQEEIIQRTVKA